MTGKTHDIARLRDNPDPIDVVLREFRHEAGRCDDARQRRVGHGAQLEIRLLWLVDVKKLTLNDKRRVEGQVSALMASPKP